MTSKTISEIKANFSKVLKEVESGNKVAITYGRKKEIKAILIPYKIKKPKRILGIMKHKGTFKFIGGHNTTLKEFFGK
jgi:antitoxin (DNA-binding transcriptional repressor) of toxin-antitoxin stability system